MQCPKCQQERMIWDKICDNCGLIFEKYEAQQKHREDEELGLLNDERESRISGFFRAMADPPEYLHSLTLLIAALWAVFVIWSFGYLTSDVQSLGYYTGFMHNINLPFHEAGHLIFGIFGKFIGSLGGTLGQLLMPVIAGSALLWTRSDTFGASICLWWFGENFIDVAPYIADARAGEMLLLGGNTGESSPYGFHDWEFILGETGLLEYDIVFANITMNIGRVIMLLAIAWGGLLLWKAWRGIRF